MVELDLPTPREIDFVSIMEDIRQGQRIRSYVVQGRENGQWRQLCDGQSIGHKRIQQFDRVMVDAVRVRATKSAAEPIIRKLAVYDIDPLPANPTNPRDHACEFNEAIKPTALPWAFMALLRLLHWNRSCAPIIQ